MDQGAASDGAAADHLWAVHELRDPRSGDLPRVEVGPAFAHGGHDFGELGVERVKLLTFGGARDEGASIASRARAPYPLNHRRMNMDHDVIGFCILPELFGLGAVQEGAVGAGAVPQPRHPDPDLYQTASSNRPWHDVVAQPAAPMVGCVPRTGRCRTLRRS
jgi:hypothetical protein